MYNLQRWTGAFTFAYIVWHTWHLRFSGVHLLTHPDAAFGKVQAELRIPGRSRFMPWESSALRGISPMACGYSQ